MALRMPPGGPWAPQGRQGRFEAISGSNLGPILASQVVPNWIFSCSEESHALVPDHFFDELNTKSTNETFGVGTLIATPSILPFKSGIISARAFDAPVEVGTIDCPADLDLLGSL